MRLNWLSKYNLLMFETIDSTNLEAKRLATGGLKADIVVWSKVQSAGKGRYGSAWQSPAGNLSFSILLDSTNFHEKQSQLTYVATLAVSDAIRLVAKREKLKLDVKLKWPNDVLISGAKVSGILLEAIKIGNNHKLIIGIGVNLHCLPEGVGYSVTSLEQEGVNNIKVDYWLDLIMSFFQYYYKKWQVQKFADITKIWQTRNYHHDEITIDQGNLRISGEFHDIDPDGALRIRLASGQIHKTFEGKVVF